jgi:molybdenum cofactor cytidylyltransferase
MELHALVLAAGAGSRFGGRKLLAPFREGRLLDGALAAAFAAPVEQVHVVVGYDARAVGAAAIAYAADVGETRMHIVEAPEHAEGLAGSLRAGVDALPGTVAGVLVFLGDMPSIPIPVLAPLAQALAGGAPAAVPVFHGRRGHPAALSAALFPDLLALSGDHGARLLLERLGRAVVEIPAPDAGVLVDVDTPADLESLSSRD